jgi:hypothetical protein
VIQTSIGSTTATIALGDLSGCQNAFNGFWTSLCAGNPDTGFSYTLTMASRGGTGSAGSGVDYCIGGSPSGTPPPSPPPPDNPPDIPTP